VLAAVFFTSPAFAADPVVGTWKLNVAKSKFNVGAELTAGTRVYTEANGLYTLDQKLTGADGKEKSNQAQYRNGKDVSRQRPGPWIRRSRRRSMQTPGTLISRRMARSLATPACRISRRQNADGTQHGYAAERRHGRRDSGIRQQ